LPIIATDCGGPRDIVTPKNGFLIPTDNQQALERAIIDMVQNMHLYNRQMIADECQNRFSSTNVAKRILKILENTIQESKKQK
jgi:glycosyltransferase involved in cell wall biosynthesis